MSTAEKNVCGVEAYRHAFTLIELLLAAVLTSIAFAGIYSTFYHGLKVEQDTSVRWRNYASATAIAEKLTDSLRHTIEVPSFTAIETGSDEDGRWLICTTAGAGLVAGSAGSVCTRLQRYRWSVDGALSLQEVPIAGSKEIWSEALPEGPQLWEYVPDTVIARDLGTLTVMFKAADDADADWKNSWNGSPQNLMVKLRVQVGEQAVERIFALMPTAPLIQ